MRALAAALILIAAAILPGQASSQGSDPCKSGNYPKRACAGFDPGITGYWHPLGRAVVRRVGNLAPRHDAQVWYLVESFDVRSPELVTFWRGPSVAGDFGSPKIWHARRYLVRMADIARLVDEAPPGANQLSDANADILAAQLPVSEAIADERGCPAITEALDRLRPLMNFKLILPPRAKGSQVFDGVVVTVGGRGELVGSSAGVEVTVSGNFDTPTTAWAYQTIKALEPCWQPAPSAA